MGHIRLGRLPHTRKWQQVVDLLGEAETTAIDAKRKAAGDVSNGLSEIWLRGQDSNLRQGG